MPSVSNLSQCVVSSSRLASIFDWKRSSRIMSLQISKHHIHMSIAENPTQNEAQHIIHELDSIPYMPKEQTHISKGMFNMRKEMIKVEMGSITNDFNVSGFVVGYPLEETGHPGAACGRVLHLLDYLADARHGNVIGPRRPLTLWDQRVNAHNQFEEQKNPQDKWGRSPAFCHYPKKEKNGYIVRSDGFGRNIQMYVSNHGKDQIIDDGNNSDCSNRILKQFLNSHYQQDEDMKYIRHTTTVPFERFLLNYEGNVESLQSTML